MTEATIEADDRVPAIRITRDFTASPAQLFRAHTDPDVFARWIGPSSLTTHIDTWDARDGGEWAYTVTRPDFETRFRGCFHTVREDRLVQTFTWEGMPDQVAIETMTFEDLGGGRTRLHATSLCDSFEDRDAMLRSGMDTGINEGYAKLDTLITRGEI